MRAFLRRFGKENSVVGQNGDRVSVDTCETAYQRGTEQRLELIKLGVINDSRNDLTDIEGLLGISRDDAV
ncbi:hypothetical protein D3C75_643890 [compost metagenome]